MAPRRRAATPDTPARKAAPKGAAAVPHLPPPKAITGRPSKLTPELTERLCQVVAAGAYREVAAIYCGIAAETFSRWMTRKSPRYAAFREAVLQAEQRAEVGHVLQVARAGASDWKASAWWLERKSPERWGRRDTRAITGPGGGPVLTKDVTAMTDAELDAFIAEYGVATARAGGPRGAGEAHAGSGAAQGGACAACGASGVGGEPLGPEEERARRVVEDVAREAARLAGMADVTPDGGTGGPR